MAGVSREIIEKGSKLFESGMVKKVLETDRRVHFSVQGKMEEHSVIYDKSKQKFFCDCRYWSLRQKTCSHIIAARRLLKSKKKRKEI